MLVRPLDRRLLRYAHTTRTYLMVLICLGVWSAVLIVVNATLIAHAIASVFPAPSDGVLRGLDGMTGQLSAIAAVIVARAITVWVQEVAAHRASAAVKSELRERFLAHVARLGPSWLTGRRSGELGAVSGPGLDSLDAYFARYLPQLVLAALVPAIVVARILPSDRIAAITIVLTLPLIPVFMILIGSQTNKASRRQFRLLARLSHHFLDVLAGLPTLKAYRRAQAQEQTIRQVTDTYRTVTLRTLRIAFLSSLTLELIATLSVALVAVGIGLRLVQGTLGFETALVVLILAPEAYLPLRQLGANYHAAAEGLAAAEEVFSVIQTPLPSQPEFTPARREIPRPDPDGTVLRLVDVTVRYPDRDVPAITGFNVTIAPQEIVALTGPSGCGKSTILSTILRFIPPDSGHLLVGEVDLGDLDPEAWRKTIAWVPQRPWLFAGTVADNIKLGLVRNDLDTAEMDAAVRRAARSAEATAFIDALPQGFETRLGEGGRGLSAGQRQRLALARAFIRDAPLVLLDEPTANLDGRTESTILDAIGALATGRTVILASHRPNLTALADREVRL